MSVNSISIKNAVGKNEAKDGTNKATRFATKLLTLSQEKDPLSES
jgi:hypothetical protein